MCWLKAVLLMSCALAVLAQEEPVAESFPPEEPELIRCKRPLCENECVFDRKLNRHGCPTCECMDNPCLNVSCPSGQQCRPVPCQTYPCEVLETMCARTMACPLRECTRDCPFGFRKDLSGCEQCECKASICEGVDCGSGMRCQTHQPCSVDVRCDMEPRCVPDDGHEVPPADGCSEVMCMMACDFGFKRDERGCEICSCSEDPCNNHVCPSHELCEATVEDCMDEDGNCPVYATCVPKPLCHHMREHPALLTAMGMSTGSKDMHQVKCQPDSGEFEYTQCGGNDCWCVDDRGVEIPDTRQAKLLTDTPSTCVRNRTQAVDVRFNMTHNLPHIQDHLAPLTEVTMIKVTEWLAIEKDYVTGMEMIVKAVDVVEVHFLLVRGVDDDIDLPTAVFHLHYEIRSQRALLDYQGQVLQPDPTSVSTQHHYEPLLPAGGGLREEDSHEKGDEHSSSESHSHENGLDDDDDSQEKYGKHGKKTWVTKCFAKLKKLSPGRIIVIVTSLCLAIMIIIGLVCVCRCMKKGRRKCYNMQKANLAFANDLYTTMHKVGGDDDKVKLNPEDTLQPDVEKPVDGSLA